MTLKELKKLVKKYQEEINLFPIESLEKQIAINQEEVDQFAIEFAEWIIKKITGDRLYKLKDNLLKDFKKEKGL